MKFLTLALLFIGLCFFSSTTFAQEDSPNENTPIFYRNSLGVAAGGTTGLGISYRHFFPNKFGFQVTGIPIFSQNHFYSSTGLSLMYIFREHERVALFSYLGNHVIYTEDNYYGGSILWDEEPIQYSYLTYNIGLGAGVNIHLWDFIDLSVKVGYGVFDIPNGVYTNLTGGIGAYYNF